MTKTEPHPDLRDAITFGLQSNVEKVSQEWESLSTDSRHQIWRVRAEPEAIIVKAYLPDVDRYYAHRWRREERALDLLNRHAPGLAPQPLTAVHASNRWAAERKETLVSGRAHAINQAREDYAAQSSVR